MHRFRRLLAAAASCRKGPEAALFTKIAPAGPFSESPWRHFGSRNSSLVISNSKS